MKPTYDPNNYPMFSNCHKSQDFVLAFNQFIASSRHVLVDTTEQSIIAEGVGLTDVVEQCCDRFQWMKVEK